MSTRDNNDPRNIPDFGCVFWLLVFILLALWSITEHIKLPPPAPVQNVPEMPRATEEGK